MHSPFPTTREEAVPLWLTTLYGHDGDRPQPHLAAQILKDHAERIRGDLFVACASGDVEAVRSAIEAMPKLAHRTMTGWHCPGCGEALDKTPLVAVALSTLVQLPAFREGLYACARLLIEAGADVNQPYIESGHTLRPLYGAAGKNQDPGMTKLLLDAGADPNDGESLYHGLEERGTECMRLLLEAGARVEGGHILHHVLDFDDLEKLRLVLAHTKDVNDAGDLGSPLLWAIRRRRSKEHLELLLAAGADTTGAYRQAVLNGLADIAELLPQEPLTVEEQFVGACTSLNEAEARRALSEHPDMFGRLSEAQLKQLPQMVESGNHDAVRLMVKLGWPIAARGGDWDATALCHAVYQGNVPLTRFLLEHGASWREEHQWGDVHGILCWASRNMSPQNDYVGCARALVEHGLPVLELDGDAAGEVAEYLAAERAKLRS